MTEHDPITVTDPTDEGCPVCGATTGVQPITGTSPKVQAWRCTQCDTSWAITSTVRPDSRWVLQQIVQLADQMPELTDPELQARLLALTQACAR